MEKQTGIGLQHTGTFSLDETVASTRNCENMVGVTQIPMGVAGPLKVHSSQFLVHGYYVPLATTEGALVASVNRGCKAISQSGGASVLAVRVGATRGPVFKVRSLEENSKLYDFLLENEKEIKEIAESTSGHLKLTGMETNSVGRYRFVRFLFDTQDAMGLNMATIATDKAVEYITKRTGVRCISLSGNYCVDKKASWQNFIRGRGFEVWAEATIPHDTLQTILKTSPEALYETWLAKCMIGSAMSGSMGYNAQFANILAALFIATGQDPAHVAECSVGITTVEVDKRQENKGLYISIYLPDLMVGTVGGGTSLATQKEALELLGVAGGNDGKNSQRFAEIVGAAVLAGELSLLASLSEGGLARAHQRLGRGKGKFNY